MKEALLIAAGVFVSIAAACSGPDFQSEGSGGSAGMGGSKAGKGGSTSGGSTSQGGSTSSGGSITPGGGPGTGGSQGQSGGSQAGGGPGTCVDASDCPASNLCWVPYCDPGIGCSEFVYPDGPMPDDVPGDCRYWACEAGQEVLVPDENDFDDGNECTSDACTIEGHEHQILAGAVCTGGICDFEGVCRQCNVDQCPDATECMMAMCGTDGCQLEPRPRGTYCGLMDSNQCDGEGTCVDCTDNGGCEECCICTAQQTCIMP